MKEQDKTSVKEFSEMEISNLPDKEFKAIVIKIGEEWTNIVRASTKRCKM